MASASAFRRASLGGNPVGRPRTANPDPGPVASALIAANRWQQKRGLDRTDSNPRAAQSGGAVSAARGQYRQERRFDNERGFYNPNATANGGSGVSPSNPFS
ncbi:MAG: hypothetical protein LW834_08075 [Cyanobium sp. 49614_E6]|jgi:hypothetical protein|nr:hypothetical protein [Cyanobium sp. 49614_E6]